MRSTTAPILSLFLSCHFISPSVTLPAERLALIGLEAQRSVDHVEAHRVTQGPEPERGAAALDQVEKDLGNPFVVACVAARPGDEDSAALVYCRKKLGAHTVAVFATRGELIEDEAAGVAGEEAAAFRTCQALEVASAEGADLYFLNLPDQSSDQSPEETGTVWEKKNGLLSMVRFIRSVHPDVIISGGQLETGDSAQLALERLLVRAIDSASEGGQFPEAGGSWSVKRLYLGGTPASHSAAINVSEFDAIRGRSYSHLAEAARRAYRPDRRHGSIDTVLYRLERPTENSSTDSSGSILAGLALPKNVAEEISIPVPGATGSAGPDRRLWAQALSGKLYVMRSTGTDDDLRSQFGADYFRVERFMRCLEKGIALALGLQFEARVSDSAVVPGQKFGIKLKFSNGTDQQLAIEFQSPAEFPLAGSTPLKFKADLTNAEGGRSLTRDYEYQVPETTPLTVPHSSHLYDLSFFPVSEGRWPAMRPFGLAFPTQVRVNTGAATISLQAVTVIDIVPPFELSISPGTALLKDFETVRSVNFTARVVNHTPGPFVGELWVVPLAITKDDYEPIPVKCSGEDETVEIPLRLQVPVQKPPLATAVLLELRRSRPAAPSALVSFRIEVKVAGLAVPEELQIGYISRLRPAGPNRLSEALQQLGCKYELIPLENLRFADGAVDLKRFDSIIVDRNAYRDLPELVRVNNKLLEYAKAGGNLVVMAQQADYWNSVAGVSPLPITLSKQSTRVQMKMARIVEEGAVLLTQPNKIEVSDLANLPDDLKAYLPDSWDSQYQAVIGYGSADSTPSRSLLLLARVGKGTYAYLAVDANQAIAGTNPVFYRLMTNLVSLPKYGARARRQNPAQ